MDSEKVVITFGKPLMRKIKTYDAPRFSFITKPIDIKNDKWRFRINRFLFGYYDEITCAVLRDDLPSAVIPLNELNFR